MAATVGETGLGGDFFIFEAGTKNRLGTLHSAGGWTFTFDAQPDFGRTGDISIADEWGDFAGVLNVKPAPVVAKEITVSGSVVNVPGSTVEVDVDNPTTLKGDVILTQVGGGAFGVLNVSSGKLILDENLSAGLAGDVMVEGVIGDGVKVFGIIKLKPAPVVDPCINVSGTLSVTDFREGNTVKVDVDNTTTQTGDVFVVMAGTDIILGTLNTETGMLELRADAEWGITGDVAVEGIHEDEQICGFFKVLPADEDDTDPVDPGDACVNYAVTTVSVTDFHEGNTIVLEEFDNTTSLVGETFVQIAGSVRTPSHASRWARSRSRSSRPTRTSPTSCTPRARAPNP